MTATTFGTSIADNYQTYLVPLIFEDYAREMARALEPGAQDVLETAAGTGVLTRHLCRRFPGARIVATDLNSSMLDVARARANGHRSTAFQEADATALSYADQSFDALACQFGIMFYPDRARGFTEAARVLRPGGQFVFNVWDGFEDNPLPDLVHRTVGALFPDHPTGFLAVPFTRQDFVAISTELRDAGFVDVEIIDLPLYCRAPGAEHVVEAFVAGTPLRVALDEIDGLDEAKRATLEAIAQEYGTGRVEAPMRAQMVRARRG